MNRIALGVAVAIIAAPAALFAWSVNRTAAVASRCDRDVTGRPISTELSERIWAEIDLMNARSNHPTHRKDS